MHFLPPLIFSNHKGKKSGIRSFYFKTKQNNSLKLNLNVSNIKNKAVLAASNENFEPTQ